MKLHKEDTLIDDRRRVERDVVVEADPDEVWEALTDEGRLEEWLAPDVELDPVEGGELSVRDDDGERHGTVETVAERERLAFTWERPEQGPSLVEFTIEAVPAGTRVVVVETSLVPGETFAPTASANWGAALPRLRRTLLLVFA